jgi:hypothetical protein
LFAGDLERRLVLLVEREDVFDGWIDMDAVPPSLHPFRSLFFGPMNGLSGSQPPERYLRALPRGRVSHLPIEDS